MTDDYPAHILLRGDARHLPLADRSVHACMTSPPYFGLRSYLSGDDPNKDREIGAEPTPAEFVEAMRAVAREVWRVLRDDGCFYINLGDSYAGSWGNQGRKAGRGTQRPINGPMMQNLDPYPAKASNTGKIPDGSGLRPGDLCLIPERVALALQSDGWVIRSKPPWIKVAPMPESTRSRPNVAHESIYMLTKGMRYYFDMDSVRVPLCPSSVERGEYGHNGFAKGQFSGSPIDERHQDGKQVEKLSDLQNPDGRHLRTNDFYTRSVEAAIAHHEAEAARLRGHLDGGGMLGDGEGGPLAFWVAAAGSPIPHYAIWPPKLVEPMIRASTSERGVCPNCGGPWVRVTEKAGEIQTRWSSKNALAAVVGGTHRERTTQRLMRTSGWRPSCPCPPADPVPAIVLDIFAGSGTTLMVAAQLGRRGIGLDLSGEYLGMAAGRIAAGLRPISRLDAPKALTPLSGQMELFA